LTQTTHLSEQISLLPALPGVYRYFDTAGQLLYVGKAKQLNKRVASYFQRQSHDGTRIGHMVRQIARIETTVVRNEVEALLLESQLIKTKKPKYNIVLRDDKSYPYLRISPAFSPSHLQTASVGGLPPRPQDYPRLHYDRQAHPHLAAFKKQKTISSPPSSSSAPSSASAHHSSYFGPYPHARSAKQTLEILQKIFRLRTCEDSVFAHRTRPCLLQQIGRCQGPCVAHQPAFRHLGMTPASYAQSVQDASDFLSGKSQTVLRTLQTRMQSYADELAFEQAAKVRDQIEALSQVLQNQVMESADAGSWDQVIDVLGIAWAGDAVCLTVSAIRQNQYLGDSVYFPRLPPQVAGEDSQAMTHEVLEAFVMQYYLERPVPDVLITPSPVSKIIQEGLRSRTAHALTFIHQPRGARRVWQEMAQRNATLQLAQHTQKSLHQTQRIEAFIHTLGLSNCVPQLTPAALRVECFDISHSSGEATMASCVVLADLAMQPSQYRRYRIQGITPGDDLAALSQALERRYGKYLPTASEKPAWPDVILIDGGRTQISAVKAVFERLGLPTDRLIGVEKGQGRKVGLEELIWADGRPKQSLPAHDPALLLIASIRDEAHRFALTGMRQQRAKTRQTSRLEELPGIGPKRRTQLLAHFGSIQAMAQATLPDLMRVPGISRQLAETIRLALSPNAHG
jgi:excinuclease ABC subunit C